MQRAKVRVPAAIWTRHVTLKLLRIGQANAMSSNSPHFGVCCLYFRVDEASSRTYPVDDCHGVVEAEHEEEGPAEGDAGQQDVADPLGALHLCVIRSRHVPTDAGGQGIQHYQGCEEAAAVVGVEDPHTGQHKDEDGQGEELQCSTNVLD